ncbi:hypothetical protein Aph01nite_43390 [Acrocarpospora phusangensis]|uniref:Uncharacterized protein n=1 Tax=Acrocarpospora phusangensis TaxID=1070424 RepID=A0A919ULI8_9ACTN|nr:hypothetical protein [Acrocarpospora phusangensis]GIH26029.1 hypothetical protein Aph01nite_43390 [Acrocarpospora phusangensis]
MADVRPPIPLRLTDRPQVGGLVCPWVNVRLADGTTDFRQTYGQHWRRAWLEQLCQVDGQRIAGTLVFLGGPNQLAEDGYFDEPPLHPECAAYVTRACPMVAGRMTHYRSGPALTEGARGAVCPDPGCDCGGWQPTKQILHGDGSCSVLGDDQRADPTGEPAHAWFAVWARSYALAQGTDGRLLGGIPHDVVRVREVSRP